LSSQDAQQIDRCLAGDQEAFARLYETYARRIKAYFLRSGFDISAADDCVQETFLRVHSSLATFDPDRGAFSVWLYAIARNVTRRQWERRKQPDNFDAELAEQVFAVSDNPGLHAEAREEGNAVQACVEALPGELANIVRLRYVEARTTRGIGELTGLPESTVRLRLQQASDLLAQCLRSKGVIE